MKQVVLIIRDGWGIGKPNKYNAVYCAHTPNIDGLLRNRPNAVLEAAGLAVGLPKGYQGSSEVGHLNMGAGRIVKQELLRINDAFEDGSFFKNANFLSIIHNCKRNNSALHLMGLVQNEGVHAHQDHLFKIMEHAAKVGITHVCIHFFADGRDTPPRSALRFYTDVERAIAEYGIGKVATIMGRYYAMDRSENWALTYQAYQTLTEAAGFRRSNGREAIEIAYKDFKTPMGEDMTDEYIPPSVIAGFSGIKDGDSIIHFNFRQDRAIQLTKMFVDEKCHVPQRKKVNVVYCGLTRYYDDFTSYILEPINETIPHTLGELISQNHLSQLRIAETQKFRHVTSFFNAKLIAPFHGEKDIEIKSVYDPASYAKHPEMNAFDVTAEVIRQINMNLFHFTVVNFANCDMVGHTGDFEATKKAVEIVDKCVGEVVRNVISTGGIALITADHGNAEEMVDLNTGTIKTSHTTNPVEFIYVARDSSTVRLKPQGILSDIAPTVLDLLGLDKPLEMTSSSLLLHEAQT